VCVCVCVCDNGASFCTVKKDDRFSRPPAGMSLTNLSMAGNYLIIPGRESLVSDIPSADRKIDYLFYGVCKQ
jgi:hypothetical protein